jgi:LysR family cyn operon transcriptional activator
MNGLLMRSLIAVADHGSITEAALALGVSQPALSRRLQLLEAEFETQLLARNQRGTELTEVGDLVVREGRALVDRYEHLRERVRAQLDLEVGSVRVGGGATAVSYLLPPAIAAFQRAHPDVVFQLKEAGSREIEQAVLEDHLELGIVTLPAHSPDLDIRRLREDRIVLVAARDHPLAERKRLSLEALRGQNLVGFEAGSAIRHRIDAALREAGVDMNVVMELRSIAAILQMVATTRSLAFVSELGVPDASAGILRLRVRGLNIMRELAIIRRRGRPLSPAGEAFSRMLIATRDPEPD